MTAEVKRLIRWLPLARVAGALLQWLPAHLGFPFVLTLAKPNSASIV